MGPPSPVPAAPAAPVVGVLTRAPSSGGKRRLFSALGRPADPALLAALLLDTLEGARVPGVPVVVAVEPASGCEEVAAMVADDVSVVPQAAGTLGERMRELMARLLAGGPRAVVLVGSDLPDLPREAIVRALAWLEEEPGALVLGPAADGGYYLIGATRLPPVFEDVAWGGPAVLAQTRAAASRAGMRVRLLDVLADVDTPADLRAVRGTRTRAWVEATFR